MGVWIETPVSDHCYDRNRVTPYVGVWIETVDIASSSIRSRSLLMWECGLKPLADGFINVEYSHSLCGSVD